MPLHRQAPRRISRAYAQELAPWVDDFSHSWCLPYLVESTIVLECPDTAALLRGESQNVQDMSGSPHIFAFRSGGTNDVDAASASVRCIRVWGIDDDYNQYIESAAMHTTSCQVFVSTAKTDWIRYQRHWAVQWGSADQDASGSISVYDTSAAGNRLGTIPQGENESEDTMLTLPKNWKCVIPDVHVSMMDQAGAGSPNTNNQGTYVYLSFNDGECDSYDLNQSVRFGMGVNEVKHPFGRFPWCAGDGTCATLQFYHRACDADMNFDYAYHIYAIIWLDVPNKATGQVKQIINAGVC